MNMRTKPTSWLCLAAALLGFQSAARAQDPEIIEEEPAVYAPPPVPEAEIVYADPTVPGPISVGLKAGVVLPQIATELQTSWGVELETAFRLGGALGGRLSLFTSVAYTQPEVARTGVADPRLPAAYDGTQTQRELSVGLGLIARFLPPAAIWNGYVGLGPRVYFLETITVGSAAGAEFGENREQSTRFGGIFLAGAERRLGPGALALEVQFGTSSLPHLITGDVSTGAIVVALAYRLFF
jgi:hypothetical protein